jgi:PAS domain S-box-containing protein
MERPAPDDLEALRRSEQRFRAAFAQQFQFMAILDAEGRVLEFNAQLDAEGRVLPRAEVLGQLFWETAWWRGRPEMQAAWPVRLAQAAAANGPLLFEDEFTSSEGELRQASAAVSAVRTADGEIDCFLVQATDTTEQRRGEAIQRGIEAQLRETQRLEAVGTLAGGIAHDFNNLVAAILGNVAVAEADLPVGHPARAPLAQINRAGQRARSLVQQILTFSRPQPDQRQAQPLQPVLDETLALLRATLPPSVEIATAWAPGTIWVSVDATQIQQVLLNLCTNAWHALPEGRGRVDVGTALAGLGKVQLWVADNGAGMDSATRERIFEPFFSTKPVNQGTGLGLSVVHGIVKAHGGSIRVESHPGQGSRFTVVLPLAEDAERARADLGGRTDANRAGVAAPVRSAQPVPSAQAAVRAATVGRIIYVDDEELMRFLVGELLTRAGHTVALCSNAEEALATLKAATEPWELLVSDVNMPGCSGVGLARELGRLYPGLPVALSSGHVSEALRAEATAAGARALMHKEDTLDALGPLVARLLKPGSARAAAS